MCGILAALGRTHPGTFLSGAGDLQSHRGPDFQDSQVRELGLGITAGLGHQRLSVMDLSAAGHQPMRSHSGRMEMVYNGEIYNFAELARAHGLSSLRSTGDSEVALELIERLGIERASQEFNGMWAIVVLDHETGEFLVSRDRFGKKPLYHALVDGTRYFASETKSFLAVDGFDPAPDPLAAARFLAQSLIDVDERSFLAHARGFPAGHTARLSATTPGVALREVRPYWTLPEPSAAPERATGDPAARFDALRELVSDAVRMRLKADVPVGIALSGGLDSSIIASVARRHQQDDLTLLSVTSPGHKEDEGAFIDIMAAHLDNPVQKFTLENSDADLATLFRTCLWHNDGPLPSFAAVLYYKLMEIAHGMGITVVLSGQGADEAFCGYKKYPFFAARSLVSHGRYGAAARLVSGFVANGTMLPQLNFKEMKRYLGLSNASLLGEAAEAAFVPEGLAPKGHDVSHRQSDDLLKYSVPFLCRYEDRMSMAWSREIRTPFLDYRVAGEGMTLPYDLKLHKGWTKYALRKAFENDLPSGITWRKDKKGFTNPQDAWLRGILRQDVLDTMSNPNAPVYRHGLVKRDAYLDLFRRYCANSPSIWFRDVFAPYSLNAWLGQVER